MDIDRLSLRLKEICSNTTPGDKHADLLSNIQSELSAGSFQLSLSRKGWYRVGGVVNNAGGWIAEKLEDWAGADGSDIFELVEKYKDSGYRVTRQNGVTHYFTSSIGDDPHQFVQLEVEEVTEVLDRNLIEPDYFPDTIEEFIDPEEFPRLNSTDVIRHYYIFRRVTDIQNFIERMSEDCDNELPIQRWFADWKRSSAAEKDLFCQHWVLTLREYLDGYGEPRMEAKPVSTFSGVVNELDPDKSMRGSVLANAIHELDHQLGYPMAWYFFMLSRKKVSPVIAEAIHNDMQGAYAYLPPRDLKVLNEWMDNPYSV